MAIMKLDTSNFYETINASTVPVMVDFYADWCQPCKRIAPLLEEIAVENEGRALVCKVNVDDNQSLASSFSIMNIPYVMSFKNGEPYKRVVGVVPKSELLGLIE